MHVHPVSRPIQLGALADRNDFPILNRQIRDGQRLIYLDSAATSQKPWHVLDAERDFYLLHNAAAHRGAHQLAEEATELYEEARDAVASFIGARNSEVIFTRSATEAINLVSYAMSNTASMGDTHSPFHVGPGDEVLVTQMEHHANLVPWQQLALRTGATLRWVPVTPDGRLDQSAFDTLLTNRTRLVAVTHQSNVLGTINPIAALAQKAHAVGALVMVDGAQSVAHQPVDMAALDADFFAFSAHKMLGPNGIGVLWGRQQLLEQMPPVMTGGSMIETVRMDHTTFLPPPQRFEAGVPMAPQATGLAAAISYLNFLGMQSVYHYEAALTTLALERLTTLPGIRIIGPQDSHQRGATISFTVEGIHPHDVGQVLDARGIAVRTGHHCARPLCERFEIPASIRASFYVYNTADEIDDLVDGIMEAQRFFA